jgi:FtsH-binding integral membrane protein
MLQSLANLLAIVGILVIAVGGLWMLIAGFSEGILWGLGMIFLPFVSLVFLILHWRRAKDPFFLQLAGIGILLVALIVAPHSLR